MHFIFGVKCAHFNALYVHNERAEQLWQKRTNITQFINVALVNSLLITISTNLFTNAIQYSSQEQIKIFDSHYCSESQKFTTPKIFLQFSPVVSDFKAKFYTYYFTLIFMPDYKMLFNFLEITPSYTTLCATTHIVKWIFIFHYLFMGSTVWRQRAKTHNLLQYLEQLISTQNTLDDKVHIICSNCPPPANMHVFLLTFGKIVNSFVDRCLHVMSDLLQWDSGQLDDTEPRQLLSWDRLLDFRSCWIVFIHVVRGCPGGLLQFSKGKAV